MSKTLNRTIPKTDATVTESALENSVETVETKVEKKKTVTAPVKKVERKYEPNDLIPCHSIYAGTLLFTGVKTKLTYTFSNMGDFQYIEYQDLLSGLLLKKQSLFAPYIIIDDEELLETHYWKEVKSIYDSMYDVNDLEDLLNLPTSQFREEFTKLPIGVKNTVKTLIATKISEGTFDSMNKIRIVDETCGTDLKLLLE